jgi:hypothetical protein
LCTRWYYGYNLADQLTSLSEPTQFGSTFSFLHDLAGRLTAVTGSAFQPGVTTYASDFKYRAWGGLKELTYGNGKTLSLTYDANLRPSTFTIPNVISKTYNYYADGSLRFSSDQLDHQFDRFNSYDHAGRPQNSLTGADARFEYNPYNPTPPPMPYEQTFGYDEIGHLNSVINLHWGSSFPYGRDYTNNRSVGNTYDNDGNLLTDPDNAFTYDASGAVRSVGTTETLTNSTFDGNGKQIKTENSVYDSQTQTWGTPTTRFYLRSSVLNGQVLSEIEANGSKRRTFIFANGATLGWQAYDGTYPYVVWQHHDARGSSFYTTNSAGYTMTGSGIIETEPAELNAMGANVGLNGPPPPPPPSEGNSSFMPFPAFGDATHPGRTYSVDGIPVPESTFMSMFQSSIENGFGLLDSAAANSIRVIGERITTQRYRYAPGSLGELYAVLGSPVFTIQSISSEPIYSDGSSGGWNWFGQQRVQTAGLPENQPRTEVPESDRAFFRSRVAATIEIEPCKKFLEELFAELNNGSTVKGILTTFDNEKFYWQNTGPYGGAVTYENGKKVILIGNSYKTEKFLSADRTGYLISQTTLTFLDETIHEVRPGNSDGAMANAVNAILVRKRKDIRKVYSDSNMGEIQKASMYWHPKLWDQCPAPRE